MTVAEWFYWLTGEVGRCFNNATLMREHTYEEDMVVGVFALWFFLIAFFILFVFSFILLNLNERVSKHER